MSYVSEKQIKQIAQKISNDYAQKNGSYDEFIAGNTKQILSTVKINDQVPYTFRTAGGSADIGDRLDDTIVGGTICWNQLINETAKSSKGITATLNNGKWDFTGTATNAGLLYFLSNYNAPSHKMLLIEDTAIPAFQWLARDMTNSINLVVSEVGNAFGSKIVAIPSNCTALSFYCIFASGTSPTASAYIQAFDLTQMFGSTIADHIYSLEQSTAGAGVAWFRSYFPKEYYDYSAPTLTSVSVASHDNIGFNAYNPTTSIAKLVGGMEYQITGDYTSLSYSSGETIAPDSDGYFTPSVSGELSVVGGNDSDTCVHLVWDGERDGEFEEYIKHSYPLDSSLELRGIPILDANNKLYYDGDIYKSDGTVTRRYKNITISGSKVDEYSRNPDYTYISLFRIRVVNINGLNSVFKKGISSKLGVSQRFTTIDAAGHENCLIANVQAGYWHFSFAKGTTLAQAQAALDGTELVYELATPTAESAAPFTNPQIVDDFGTEEYTNPRSNPEAFSIEKTYNVGDFVSYDGHCYRCITAVTEVGEWDSTKWELDDLIVEVPVGHDTEYYPNMRAKLEMAPDSPDGETGNYVVNHTKESGENKYIPFGTAIQNDAGLNNELNRKANADGYYETLTAGTSEQLLSTVSINDKVPYNFRTSGGSADIGNRLTDKIVGGTICWNQLVQNGDFSRGSYGWTTSAASCSVSDGIATVTSTRGSGGLVQNISITTGHKYLVCTNVSLGDADFIASVRFNQQDINIPRQEGWQSIRRIIIGDKTKNNSIYFRLQNGGNTLYVGKTNTFDLTQMFGAAIADYIYSLEQSTAGAGVAWFNNLFPKDYYAYNAGEMLSVNVSSHDTVGFNAYDNASGKAKLVGGMDYQITGTYTALAYSTGETITPDANGKFTPSENGELTVTGGNTTDTCVHLVWDGEKDGEFEEYIKRSYSLDSSLTLRGVPMLDVNDKLYFDGDIYESDGTVTRRYGIVDLGGLNWDYNAAYSYPYFYVNLNATNPFVSTGGMMCANYTRLMPNMAGSTFGEVATDKCFNIGSSTNSGYIKIRDTAYTDAASFKAAMSGVYLIYTLETPTTESADPYTNPQIVDDFGTEEYVDYAYSQGTRDVAVPVGHDTLYMNNLRAKLEMSPDSPDGDGYYIVRQSDGENTYVQLTKELPPAPTEDGTYKLSVTVANGTPTYSWEAQS